MENPNTETFAVIMTIFTLATTYMFPTILAVVLRRYRVVASIGILNFFMGWTVIAWVCALVWACLAREPKTVVIELKPELLK